MFICYITAFVAPRKNHGLMIDEVPILHFNFLERDAEPCPKRKTNRWKLVIPQYYQLSCTCRLKHVYRKKGMQSSLSKSTAEYRFDVFKKSEVCFWHFMILNSGHQ